jgi:hypothetical protein
MSRFGGACKKLVAVDERPLSAWISSIDFAEWPQQSRLPDGKMRPAMVNDVSWHGFGTMVEGLTAGLVAELRKTCPDIAASFNPLLSVVMPGHSIEPHRDLQQPDWFCRVHVPLLTNDGALMLIGRETHHLETGYAYLINTFAEHSVENRGNAPRVHYMFDVRV